jgi:hypothetical protein
MAAWPEVLDTVASAQGAVAKETGANLLHACSVARSEKGACIVFLYVFVDGKNGQNVQGGCGGRWQSGQSSRSTAWALAVNACPLPGTMFVLQLNCRLCHYVYVAQEVRVHVQGL